MTIYDVLKENIKVLESMRISTKELELWNAIQTVLQNEQVCIQAMEEADQKNKEGDQEEENVILLGEAQEEK